MWSCTSRRRRSGAEYPESHGLVRNIGRATVWCGISEGLRFGAEYPRDFDLVRNIGGTAALECCALAQAHGGGFRARHLASRGIGVPAACTAARIGVQIAFKGLGSRSCADARPWLGDATYRESRWTSACPRCLGRGANRESHGLVLHIGRTKSLTSKGGAVPAEGRGLGVLRIATARSRLMLTMGRASHCAKPRGTLRFECPEDDEARRGRIGCPSEARVVLAKGMMAYSSCAGARKELAARLFQSHRC